MKLKRPGVFIAVSSIALALVLIIQANWILNTIKTKEEIFNEKTGIILARTTEALAADSILNARLESGVDEIENQKIDSLVKSYMNYYSFHVDYSFEVIHTFFSNPVDSANILTDSSNSVPQACYNKSLHEMEKKNKWQLKLYFPAKEKFIRTEATIPFITSIILVLVVLILFWRTVLSLMKEKRISEHTTDFLNNMTHEFKTPLTNIALAGKMIVKDSSLKQDEKIKHYSGIILEENEKLRLQVEQVLSMTALERGEIPIQKTELNFHQLIEDSLRSMSLQIESRKGELKLDLAAEKFVIMGDRTHLANSIRNLIDNALKYSGEKPVLGIQTANRDQSIFVAISDNGIGIEKEYQGKIFNKFFRVPTGDVHDVRGFGLGLAYVKKIVELHNGTIELASEKGRGTTFTIALPYA